MPEYEITDEEADLINYLRGYDEDGEEAPNGLRITIEFRAGWCLVEQRQGFGGPTMIGEHVDFPSAWLDRCEGDLRFAAPKEPEQDQQSQQSTKPNRPQLRLVKGGVDS